MNKIITAVCVALAATTALAMPNRQELAKAKPLVEAQTKADLTAYKAGNMTAKNAADSHVLLAQKAGSQAEKYLLYQGAFKLYARSGEYDLAADAIQIMKREVKDVPPEVIAEIVGDELRYVSDDKAPRLVAMLKEAKGAASATGENTEVAEPAAAVAENKKTIDGSTWSYTVKNGEATIEAKKDGNFVCAVSPAPKGRFTIPAVIDGAEVRHLGKHSFMGSAMSDVCIPEGVKTIGHGAFSWSSGLRSVTISSTVTEIGDVPFISSDAMERFSVAEANNSFSSRNGMLCTKDGTVLVSGVNGKVTIPDGVTTIKNNAFHRCGRLEAVTIPASVSNINSQAFFCTGLRSVTMLGERPNAAQNAFDGCDKLLAIHVPANAKSWAGMKTWLGKQLVFDHKETIGDYTWSYRVENGEATIELMKNGEFCCAVTPVPTGRLAIPATLGGAKVTGIGNNAFNHCEKLESVELPMGLARIGEHAFERSGVKSMAIPASVTNIACWAFGTCPKLESFSVDSKNPVFCAKNNLLCSKDGKTVCSGVNGDVTIPDGVVHVGGAAFAYFEGLKSLTIPASVKDIGSYGIHGCGNLEAVTMFCDPPAAPPSVFIYCDRIVVYVPNKTKSWEGMKEWHGRKIVFAPKWNYEVKDGEIILGGNGRTAVPTATKGDLVIPATIDGKPVRKIGNGAFAGCKMLETLKIPDGVTSIGNDAFSECEKLTTLTIPEGVTSMGAFSWCKSLTALTIPATVTNFCGQPPFEGCNALKSVRVAEGNRHYKCENGLLLTKDGLELVRGFSVTGDVKIPEGVTNIRHGAFGNWVRSVAFPSTLKDIGSWTFPYCEGIKSLAIPVGVTNIGHGAFFNAGIKSLSIPSSVQSIRGQAFARCYSLETVTISSGLTSVEPGAFGVCTVLKSFAVDSGNSCYSSRNGMLCSKDGSILVVGVNGDVKIPDGVKSIAADAFTGFNWLTALTIPQSVTTISKDALRHVDGYCNQLTLVTLLGERPDCPDGTFNQIPNLKEIHVPANAKSWAGMTEWQGKKLVFDAKAE